MSWMEALGILDAFLLRQLTRPLWQVISMAVIIMVIGNAAMGEFRRRIREPMLAAWRSRPFLVCILVGGMSCFPILFLGWHKALAVAIYGSSFVRRPVFWLGDRAFDRWTKPVRYRIRKAMRRSRALRTALRHPRAGLAAVYSTFETLRERRRAGKQTSRVE